MPLLNRTKLKKNRWIIDPMIDERAAAARRGGAAVNPNNLRFFTFSALPHYVDFNQTSFYILSFSFTSVEYKYKYKYKQARRTESKSRVRFHCTRVEWQGTYTIT